MCEQRTFDGSPTRYGHDIRGFLYGNYTLALLARCWGILVLQLSVHLQRSGQDDADASGRYIADAGKRSDPHVWF